MVKEWLRPKALVWMVSTGRDDQSYFSSIQIHKTKGKQRGNLIQEVVHIRVEEERRNKVLVLSQQGAWTPWENFMKRRISWFEIWHAAASRLKYLVQSVRALPPSLANLFPWGKSRIPSCPLCHGKVTLRHIMSAYSRGSGDGKYSWRHDQVLRTVADTVDTAIHARNFKPGIYFVKAGEYPPHRINLTLTCNLPPKAGSWE